MSPADAFRFARGERVTTETGLNAQLRRPYDFLVVADHAEYLGGFLLTEQGDPAMLATSLGQKWRAILARGTQGDLLKTMTGRLQTSDPGIADMSNPIRQKVWRAVAETADRFNEPGRFSTFSGYEWSPMPGGNNLHRVVLFKDGADKVSEQLPLSSLDSTDPEALWRHLAEYERRTGGEALAIPHNSNLSNGDMFSPTRRDGTSFTREYSQTRRRWEPVVEVTQYKGDSETHPLLSPGDEFADFERWDRMNLGNSAANEPWMLRYEYARSALLEGLRYQAQLGENPFMFGMIGSTDTHNGLSTTTEDNFFGKWTHDEPSPTRTRVGNELVGTQAWQLASAGLAAVWASENTRESIFAAFKRREVYATTGSRIRLRFFGGWTFTADDVRRIDFADIGYEKGVPMGGELAAAPAEMKPTFMVFAGRDPDEANLDRVQIIKGWIDADGEVHERIFDVAVSDGRVADPVSGKVPPVTDTVDVKNATYTNSVGAPELATVWTDREFDPKQLAFYYVRVIEIPKPRWTTYDVKFFGTTPPAEAAMKVQDRAYSSPIWYRP